MYDDTFPAYRTIIFCHYVDQTESEWTPIITTPDGWIMIQSPTTKKPQTTEDTTDKLIPDSTSQSTTSGRLYDSFSTFDK